jgi:hypothetical protein
MKDIGAHVGYTVLWGRVSKVVGAGMQMCYYPAASPFHVMAVLSGTRVVRALCVWEATPCCVAAVCASGSRPSVLGCVLWPLVVLILAIRA